MENNFFLFWNVKKNDQIEAVVRNIKKIQKHEYDYNNKENKDKL